jgi:DNA-binding MarR family transcriptional regulator
MIAGQVRPMLLVLENGVDREISRVAGPLGMSVTQAMTLRELSIPLSIHQLARKVGAGTANMSEVVNKLAEIDLVTRERDASDKRVVRVTLTDDGRDLRSSFIRAYEPSMRLTEMAQLEAFARLLNQAATLFNRARR